MPKFNREVCEVCGHAVVDETRLPQAIRDEIYRPKPGESYNTEIDFEKPGSGIGSGQEDENPHVDVDLDETEE